MKFVNGWKSEIKQWDKLDITVRVSSLTVLKVEVDISKKEYDIKLLNFGITNKKKKNK